MSLPSFKEIISMGWFIIKPVKYQFIFNILLSTFVMLIFVYIPILIAQISDDLSQNPSVVSTKAFWLLGLTLIYSLFSYFQKAQFEKFNNEALIILLKQTHDKCLSYNSDFYHKNDMGKLSSLLTYNSQATQQFFCNLYKDIITLPINLIISLIAIYTLLIKSGSGVLYVTLGLFIAVAIILIFVNNYFKNKIALAQQSLQECRFNLNNEAMNSITSPVEIQLLMAEDARSKSFENTCIDNGNKRKQANKLLTVHRIFETVLPLIMQALFIIIACLFFQDGNIITPGLIIAVLLLIPKIISPIQELIGFFAEMHISWPEVSPLIEILNLEDSTPYGKDSFGEENSIDVNGLEFAYPDGPKILKDFSLTIPQGEKLAICARSGEGKSTLLNVLLRLYPFQKAKKAPRLNLVHMLFEQSSFKTLMITS